jgi:hypothetical protein
VAHLLFCNRTKPNKKSKRATKPTHMDIANIDRQTFNREEALLVTRVWQKWRFSAPQTHLWLIKVWFSASTFVVKIATFAKPENVSCK